MKGVIPKQLKISSIRQEDALGLGHAISCAEHLLKKEPFAVLLPDEYLLPDKKFNDLKRLVKDFNSSGFGQILLEKIGHNEVSNFGIVNMKNKSEPLDKKISITDLIEKPKKSLNKINYRIVGRYVLPYEIISILKKSKESIIKRNSINRCLTSVCKKIKVG